MPNVFKRVSRTIKSAAGKGGVAIRKAKKIKEDALAAAESVKVTTKKVVKKVKGKTTSGSDKVAETAAKGTSASVKRKSKSSTQRRSATQKSAPRPAASASSGPKEIRVQKIKKKRK